MKILVISSTVWNNDNSFGNTFSNLFEDMEDVEIANIYCNYGLPKNNIDGSYFQITEKTLVNHFFNRTKPAGYRVTHLPKSETKLSGIENRGLTVAKQKRWIILFWVRKLIWFLGNWKSKELHSYISEFNPDLIFVPLYHPTYLNRIILHVKNITNAKLVSYAMDDVYSLKRKSINPLYWIERITNVRLARKVMKESDLLYSISEFQQKEIYEDYGIKSDILRKGVKLVNENKNKSDSEINTNTPLKLIYTGNIYLGRDDSLGLIKQALEEINQKHKIAELYIYSGSKIDNKTNKKIISDGNTFFMGSVPAEEIADIQNNADILVHVESVNDKERLEVRHSLSTKIVDYLSREKCILAVGIDDVASIQYLKSNGVGIVVDNVEDIKNKLLELYEDRKLLENYKVKSSNFISKHHDKEKIQDNLKNDLYEIIKK